MLEVEGDAITAAAAIVAQLHFSFVDPYNLGELRLELRPILASPRGMDIMVHISAMDLFRNFDRNLAGAQREFETFAPGWKQHGTHGSLEGRAAACGDEVLKGVDRFDGA